MGRSERERKRARKQQQPVQQPMMFMMPPPMMQPQQQSHDESSSDDQDVEKKNSSAVASTQQQPSAWDDLISSSCTFVKTVARTRLSELVEALNSDLDACVTAPLSNHGLLALIFVFTRTKPISKISELRTMSYKY